MPQTKIQGKFYPLKSEEWLDSINQLTHSELKILYYIRSLDPYNNGIKITSAQIAKDLSTEKHKMYRSTVGRAIRKLEEKGFVKPGLYLSQISQHNLEVEIANSLHKRLGGLTEVSTSAGRIDLLTDDEIVEVKRINDWKAALGQILVYSAFYPEHRKRIHLFGKCSELTKLPDIEAACLAFDVNVTAEEV
jgi:hypothetical protein